MKPRRHTILLGAVGLAGASALAIITAWRSSDEAWSRDFWTVYGWCQQWLLAGADPYHGDAPDYPPNALVTFAALAILPREWAAPVWATVTIAATLLLPVVLLSRIDHRLVLLSGLFLCWAPVQTVLQFSQVSLLLACSVLVPGMHWAVQGVLLGLAVSKPHVAGPLLLWVACRRRFGVVTVAALTVAFAYAIYCVRAEASLTRPFSAWVTSLGTHYLGVESISGYTSLRPWVQLLIADVATADAAWIGMSLLGILAACALAAIDRTGTLALPGLLCLMSLLAVYHNLNNLILMLPAFAFLLFANDGRTQALRRWTVAAVQVVLMLNAPARLGSEAHGVVALVVAQSARLVVLLTVAVVLWTWWRQQLQSDADASDSRVPRP
jgi:hypothetical protein